MRRSDDLRYKPHVIGGIVCFFPALVTIMYGIRSVPAVRLELMSAYGASRWTVLRKVQLPSALPSVFASLRINVPASVIGARVVSSHTDRPRGFMASVIICW